MQWQPQWEKKCLSIKFLDLMLINFWGEDTLWVHNNTKQFGFLFTVVTPKVSQYSTVHVLGGFWWEIISETGGRISEASCLHARPFYFSLGSGAAWTGWTRSDYNCHRRRFVPPSRRHAHFIPGDPEQSRATVAIPLSVTLNLMGDEE